MYILFFDILLPLYFYCLLFLYTYITLLTWVLCFHFTIYNWIIKLYLQLYHNLHNILLYKSNTWKTWRTTQTYNVDGENRLLTDLQPLTTGSVLKILIFPVQFGKVSIPKLILLSSVKYYVNYDIIVNITFIVRHFHSLE
jgi:hypothetical protein